MNRLLFKHRRPASLESVRELRRSLDEALSLAVEHNPIRYRIQLLMSEAANNLIQHAQPAPNWIQIGFGRDSGRWWLEIFDDGASWDGFDTCAAPLPTPCDPSERGRGLGLLRSECDRLEYRAGDLDTPNRLRLEWRIPDQLRQPNVLIVDDDRAQCRLYAAYLADHFATVVATDGLEALERLRTGNVDLVLSDIRMPNMDGIKLRERLVHNRDGALIPFIFLTGLADETLQEQASDMGVDDYLSKPVGKDALIRTIRRVLERSKQLRHTLSERLEERITRALKPKLPNRAYGWRLATAGRNTGIGGGDFILHHDHGDRLTLALVDTMGHDDSAKFFSHAYAGYLRGIMSSACVDSNPEQLLELLSAAAWQDDLFSDVTLTCCTLCLQPGAEIRIASAGHPPALHLGAHGMAVVPVSGILPGLLPAASYAPVSLCLAAGERLAVYTDGIFESAPTAAARRLLERRVKETLLDTLSEPIETSLQESLAVFDQLTGGRATDDASLLLLEPDPAAHDQSKPGSNQAGDGFALS